MGHWQRTAILLAGPEATDVLLQLHDIQLQRWDARGLVLAGFEVEWNRKQRSTYRQSWFVVLPPSGDHAANISVERRGGVLCPADEVCGAPAV
jgi:hypothetical protein